MKKLPEFLIVGAAKCGTTSLYAYLKEHPSIFMPEKKEPRFFAYKNSPPQLQGPTKMEGVYTTITQYMKLFAPKGKEQISGEASPVYLALPEITIQNILETYKEHGQEKPKIIIMLREPISRMWSMFCHFKRNLAEPKSYKTAFSPDEIKRRVNDNRLVFYDHPACSTYSAAVQQYKENFEHVKIILLDELKNDQHTVMDQVYDFLGVTRNNPTKDDKVYNQTGILRHKLLLPFYSIYLYILDRNLARFFIPLSKKNRRIVRFWLEKNFLKKQALPQELIKQFTGYFDDDLASLHSFLNTEQQNIVNKRCKQYDD